MASYEQAVTPTALTSTDKTNYSYSETVTPTALASTDKTRYSYSTAVTPTALASTDKTNYSYSATVTPLRLRKGPSKDDDYHIATNSLDNLQSLSCGEKFTTPQISRRSVVGTAIVANESTVGDRIFDSSVQRTTQQVLSQDFTYDKQRDLLVGEWDYRIPRETDELIRVSTRDLTGRIDVAVEYDSDGDGTVDDRTPFVLVCDPDLYEFDEIPIEEGHYRLVVRVQDELPQRLQFGFTRP